MVLLKVLDHEFFHVSEEFIMLKNEQGALLPMEKRADFVAIVIHCDEQLLRKSILIIHKWHEDIVT